MSAFSFFSVSIRSIRVIRVILTLFQNTKLFYRGTFLRISIIHLFLSFSFYPFNKKRIIEFIFSVGFNNIPLFYQAFLIYL